ncbi:MAG: SAF domain-containing protein [Firmicutes bacterium]|nr:SAF domain-containing protein [Bacillota bacterium]
MKQWKALIGAVLMILALAGMVVWEGWGRDALLLTDVVVASGPVMAGELLTAEDLTILGVPEECMVEGAIAASELGDVAGMYAVNSLAANQQIGLKDLAAEEQIVRDQETAFVIPEEWIAMRSSSLRKGDEVTLYRLADYTSLGTYTVAFVKNDQDQEVYSLEGVDDQKLLSRTDSNLTVHHIEVVAKLEDYQLIREAAIQDGGLLVVQEVTR